MDNTDLNFTQNINDGICIISVKGRIDSNNADLLLSKLEEALEEKQKTILLNMSRVDYLSSIGIRVILKIYKQANEIGSSFSIERPSEIVKNVLGILALQEMLVKN
ncbi:MAG: STAS domain-containing protein [Treponema sp.]|nr:STAS domain-containing protein [Treponema sp.]